VKYKLDLSPKFDFSAPSASGAPISNPIKVCSFCHLSKVLGAMPSR